MNILKITAIFLLLSTLLYANAIFTEFKAEPAPNRILLQWRTSQENNVDKFVVERSSDNRNFTDMGEVDARGAGFEYSFTDDQLGKMKSVFYYRLRVVNKDGSFQHNDALPVIPNISSITRTWGSIKALFR